MWPEARNLRAAGAEHKGGWGNRAKIGKVVVTMRTSPKNRWLVSIGLVVGILLALGAAADAAPADNLQDQARTDLDVGGMVNGWDSGFPAGQHMQIADTEFSAVTGIMFMGWDQGWANPGTQNIRTQGLDEVVQWAKQTPGRSKTVHGHVLVYPLSNKSLPWYQNSSNHEQLLETYVRRVASSNAGNVDVWHVVNEAFADPQWETPGQYGFRTAYWNPDINANVDLVEYHSIGPDYVEKAFRWARESDPNAVLIINEYGAAAEGPKADALFEYVTAKRAEGVPIDGVGFQMHLTGHSTEPDYNSIRRNLQRFANAGLKLYITELDVTARTGFDQQPPSATQRARQARIYEEIARIATEQPAVEALMLWDFVDNRSWLHPAITTLGVANQPWNYVPEGSYTFPTPWSGGRDQPAQANGNYDALMRGLAGSTDVPEGPVWMSTRWESQSSYMGRSAGFDGAQWRPLDRVELRTRTPASEQWWSMQWIFEPAGGDLYWIKSRWPSDGYLTRMGIANGGGGWNPGSGLHLYAKTIWSSQLWRVEPLADGSHRITSAWNPQSGTLTRVGVANGSGGYNPTNRVALYPANAAWSSQSWDITSIYR